MYGGGEVEWDDNLKIDAVRFARFGAVRSIMGRRSVNTWRRPSLVLLSESAQPRSRRVVRRMDGDRI
jgi:hypothetical protein